MAPPTTTTTRSTRGTRGTRRGGRLLAVAAAAAAVAVAAGSEDGHADCIHDSVQSSVKMVSGEQAYSGGGRRCVLRCHD